MASHRRDAQLLKNAAFRLQFVRRGRHATHVLSVGRDLHEGTTSCQAEGRDRPDEGDKWRRQAAAAASRDAAQFSVSKTTLVPPLIVLLSHPTSYRSQKPLGPCPERLHRSSQRGTGGRPRMRIGTGLDYNGHCGPVNEPGRLPDRARSRNAGQRHGRDGLLAAEHALDCLPAVTRCLMPGGRRPC